jgi:hypothetical protein
VFVEVEFIQIISHSEHRRSDAAGLEAEKLQDLQFTPEVEQDFIPLHLDLHRMTGLRVIPHHVSIGRTQPVQIEI